ncbi:MAG: HAD-IB family phosphatase [Solirubrobacterales bacterium]
MSKLHIFDMDGTLLPGSACLELSRQMGEIEAVSEIEAAWAVGEVGHVEFYELCLPLWEGMRDEDVDAVFERVEWISGIREVWSDIAQRGEHSAVITLSPKFFADRLMRWGLGSAHAAEVQAGVLPDPALVLTPESKVEVARGLMRRYRLGPGETVAYGDSSSDIPLFETLVHTVAVNATASLRDVAAVEYEGLDLRDAYAAGRRLISGTATESTRSA